MPSRAAVFVRWLLLALVVVLAWAVFSRLRYIPLGYNQVFDVYRHTFCSPRACYRVPITEAPFPPP